MVVGGGRTVFVSELLCGGVGLEPGGQNKTNTRPLSAERMCTATRRLQSGGSLYKKLFQSSCAAMFNLAFIVKSN